MMKIEDVVGKVQASTSLQVSKSDAFCAVCHKAAYRGIAIYAPRAESIPLCSQHYRLIDPQIVEHQERLKKKQA